MKPQIVNIINFIRGNEPRDSQLDLTKPIINQIRLLNEYGLPGTFLIQYDAMLRDDIVELLKKELDKNCEIGVWLEVVQPLAEKAGIKWRGRPGFAWDWHSNVGFMVGYTKQEREHIIDKLMEKFKEVFGKYPKSVGSWIIDAHSLAYLYEKYGIEASCNCKDQWGTDGYTFWGGYYGQGYYPSRKNVFCPAQSKDNQIPVPIFRMLGSDPIYQYNARSKADKENELCEWQPVVTLEPVYPNAGGSPDWVQWYFAENFNGMCLSFGYTQVGQENSFGWDLMEKGLEYQINLISKKIKNGTIKAETLQSTANWYKSQYELTPASAIVALNDWKKEDKQSIWYYSRFYRVNLFLNKDRLSIRDIHIFDEDYSERYLSDICKDKDMIYDNLPVLDGNRWSKGQIKAGIIPVEITSSGEIIELLGGETTVLELGEDVLAVAWILKEGGTLKLICDETQINITAEFAGNIKCWGLKMTWHQEVNLPEINIDGNIIKYEYNNFKYNVKIGKGGIQKQSIGNEIILQAKKKKLVLDFYSLN